MDFEPCSKAFHMSHSGHWPITTATRVAGSQNPITSLCPVKWVTLWPQWIGDLFASGPVVVNLSIEHISQIQYIFHIFTVNKSCQWPLGIKQTLKMTWVTCRGVLRAGCYDVFKEGIPLDVQYIALVATHFWVVRIKTARLKHSNRKT